MPGAFVMPLSVPVVEIADIRPATEGVRAERKCLFSLLCRGVSCDDCGTDIHSEPLCLGVDRSIIIDVLLQDGSALSYRCFRCWGNPGRTNNFQDRRMVSRVMSIIGNLVSEGRKLA